MSIMLPTGHPGADLLQKEGMTPLSESAVGETRVLRIGLVNLMPRKEATEIAFAAPRAEHTCGPADLFGSRELPTEERAGRLSRPLLPPLARGPGRAVRWPHRHGCSGRDAAVRGGGLLDGDAPPFRLGQDQRRDDALHLLGGPGGAPYLSGCAEASPAREDLTQAYNASFATASVAGFANLAILLVIWIGTTSVMPGAVRRSRWRNDHDLDPVTRGEEPPVRSGSHAAPAASLLVGSSRGATRGRTMRKRVPAPTSDSNTIRPPRRWATRL